jgi:hypothetical protein
MRWIPLFLLVALPYCVGCGSAKEGNRAPAPVVKIGAAQAPMAADRNEAAKEFVAHQEAGAPNAPGQPEKQPEPKAKEKPRKIRYTADMKLVVEKLDEAEEALDEARKEAKGDYEKAEVNRSSNTVRSGMWRVRVPVENLNSFRKAVKKIGEVDRDTIESEDMTAKYYDLDAHIINRKAEQKATREFLTEIGKKDPRYLEVKRELDAISDDINRKEGQIKLWRDLTDMTTFTIHMREKQAYVPVIVKDKEDPPEFSERANTAWTKSWDTFVGFCQAVAIVAIAMTPWLIFPLIFFTGVWLVARRLLRRAPEEVVVIVESADSKKA